MSTGSSAVEYFKALLEATKKEEEEDYDLLLDFEDGEEPVDPPEDYYHQISSNNPDNPSPPTGLPADEDAGPDETSATSALDDLLFPGFGGGKSNSNNNVSLPALWDLRDSWNDLLQPQSTEDDGSSPPLSR